MHSRVEEMANKTLKMEVPDAKRVQVIILDEIVK
ncbi:MAG: cell division protein FtsL [Methylophilaceae bacterium]